MIKKLTDLQSPHMEQAAAKSNNTSNGFASNSATSIINTADYEDVFDHHMELDDQLNISTGNDNFDARMEFSGAETTKASIDKLTTQVLAYGQELQAEFADDPRKEVREGLNKAFALMAYTDPRESSVAGILDVKERVTVAEELNSAILGTFARASYGFFFNQPAN